MAADKAEVIVGVITPYLIHPPEAFDWEPFRSDDPEMDEVVNNIIWSFRGNLKWQIARAGYDPNNFRDIDGFETPTHLVRLKKQNPNSYYIKEMLPLHLAVVGMTLQGRRETRFLNRDGVPVVRYSIHYGHGAAERGYAFDIPKKVPLLTRLITFDPFLDGIVAREEKRIREALVVFNKDYQQQPVIATDYLAQALKG